MLPKKHRLPLRTELKRVKNKSILVQGGLFGLLISPQVSKTQPPRFGFIISTKVHKKAVKRNRAKRLLTEAVLNLSFKTKPGFDVVFLAKKKITEANFEEIKREVKKLFVKAGLIK